MEAKRLSKFAQRSGDFEQHISRFDFKSKLTDLYRPTNSNRTLSAQSIEEWKTTNEITITHGYSQRTHRPAAKRQPVDLPNPVLEFHHIEWPHVDHIDDQLETKFERPTPIQSATWPLLLSGYNVIGIAKTGSGKTLAFVLPAIVHVRALHIKQKSNEPRALMILPTRELALQVDREIQIFARREKGKPLILRHMCVYGGQSSKMQLNKIGSGVDIVVATPGRLFDFVSQKQLILGNVSFVVWDEADALLDMGFLRVLSEIMKCIRSDKQMLMFSATFPNKVRKCAAEYLLDDNGNDENVVQVSVGSMDTLNANKDITQQFEFFSGDRVESKKKKHLEAFLKEHRHQRVLVFLRSKHTATRFARIFTTKGIRSKAICGKRCQKSRTNALKNFRGGHVRVLFATDVAGRGIHVDDIDYVINYDLPTRPDDFEYYVHRIGRTARAGCKGTAISYVVPRYDGHCAPRLIQLLKDCEQEVPPELYDLNPKKCRFKLK